MKILSLIPPPEFKYDRYLYLDVLKGLAILGVFFLHYNMSYPSSLPYVSKFSAIGARCPQLFFIISAFLTWSSFERESFSWFKFYKSKFFRIAPMYYLAIFVGIILPCCSFMKFSVADYLSHLFFVNALSPLYIHDILRVEWYIADLAIFFMLCPVIKRLIKNLEYSIYCFVIATSFSSICLVLSNLFFSLQIQNNINYEQYFHTFFIVHQLPVLILGIILHYTSKKKICWLAIGIYCLLCIGILGIFTRFSLNKVYMTSSWMAGLLFSCIFLIFHKVEYFFNYSLFIPLTKLGKYSLGIYLFHWLIIEWFKIYLYPQGVLQWFGLFIICIILSYYIGKLLENGLIYLLKHTAIIRK